MNQQPNMKSQQAHYKTLPTLYVGELPDEVYDLELYKLFDTRGYRVAKAKSVLDKKTNKPLGYGYVCFPNKDDADRALKEVNNLEYKGKKLRVMWKIEKNDKAFNDKANVYVKNIDEKTTQQDLYELFSTTGGEVVSCKLELFKDGSSRGFGFVQFKEETHAEQAIEKLNGHKLHDKNIEVCKFAKRDDRDH